MREPVTCVSVCVLFAADDGFISWEEFVSYFADGVMGKEELQALFNEIDTHNTKWVTLRVVMCGSASDMVQGT